MASTGAIIVGIIVVAGAAAAVTKPSADSFAPEMTRVIAAQSGQTDPSDLQLQNCGDDVRRCAASLRDYREAMFAEADYVVARTASVTWDGAANANCIGAFGNWWCSTSED